MFFSRHVIPTSLQEVLYCPVLFRLPLIFFPQTWDGSFSASVDGLQVDFLAALLRHSPITNKITKQLKQVRSGDFLLGIYSVGS